MTPPDTHPCAYCGRPAVVTIQRKARPLRWLLHGAYPRRWVCRRDPCVESAVYGR